MLQVEGIHTYYGQSHVLQGVALAVEQGQAVAVLGRNGMGKTTLIRSIIGLTPPRQGRVAFKGVDITRRPPHQIAKAGIGLVPQGRRIFPSLTVRENLLVAARPQPEGRWDLTWIMRTFPHLRERADHKGNKLSGGEQQMLAIARALMTAPDFLLMDEPSEGLAPLMVTQVGNILSDLKHEGLSMLLVEQNLPLALKLADRVYVLSKGRVVFTGSPQELVGAHEIQHRYLGV